ncbi:MAG: transposase [Chloroflexi bacterium]|nr:transposase [Chloroflexota bacterium]
MTLGRAKRQRSLWDDLNRFCEATLGQDSVYALLQRERERLFPDEFFADLFAERGRRSVPPSVVATVMVLQRLEGCSDREAVERYSFDARWRYASGVGGYGGGGRERFAHTVLVDMRERLRRSARPDRVFEVVLEAARAAGLVGRRRVLDSTPLYDAVATMDTVTLIRSALRGLLQVAGTARAAELRGVLRSGDDYASAAKPQIDWDDPAARAALVDSRAQDAYACLALLEDRELAPPLAEAAALLATVVGQDLEASEGRFRIARRVARDRVISTVDPEARHGHKTAARSFDGYKGHVAIDPNSEIITATAVTPGNAGDASVAEALIADLLQDDGSEDDAADVTDPDPEPGDAALAGAHPADAVTDETEQADSAGEDRVVYGDNAYGTGAFHAHLEEAGIVSRCKTQRPTAPGGMLAKDRFQVDLDGGIVTCPAGVAAAIRERHGGGGGARFGDACLTCPLRATCTSAAGGRTITIHPHEATLARARARQAARAWCDDYRATRPKVERKQGHLMRRQHGGRRARVRGTLRVDGDFRLLAAATNLARLAVLKLQWMPAGRWAIA